MAEAGSVGNVDEAQEMMKQVETMRQERETLKAARTEDPQKKVFLVSLLVWFVRYLSKLLNVFGSVHCFNKATVGWKAAHNPSCTGKTERALH